MILHYVVSAAFVINGLAHLSGFTASWTSRDSGFTNAPWLFSGGITLRSGIGRFFGVLWLVAAIVLVLAGVGLFLGGRGWPGWPLAGCALSLLAIVPWWRAVVPGARVGAIFDILMIVVLASPWQEQVLVALS